MNQTNINYQIALAESEFDAHGEISNYAEVLLDAAKELRVRVKALTEHNKLLSLDSDPSNAVALMSPSWQLAAKNDSDALTRFVEMAHNQFEIRDQLAKDKAELYEALQDIHNEAVSYQSRSGKPVTWCMKTGKLLEKHK